ncbi:MAG TPA: helix-turn-helix domain-containing protein, partial [Thermomicrobiales bacterium]|nr:helix-turn-helix domain-containing protein [Thermomicrobiales bacterium]
SEIFAERWTPLIMRELLMGCTRFNELERGLPRISRSVLSQRLKQLEQDGLIERRSTGGSRSVEYVPTPVGQGLFDVIMLLGEWGARWFNEHIDPKDLDPNLLMWDMHRRVDVTRLPEQLVVVRFDFTGLFQQSNWLILDRQDVSVCYVDPGFEVDLIVTTDTMALHRIWAGHLTFDHALRTGEVRIDGPRGLSRQFPGWLQLSAFAHIRPARAA